MITSRDTSSELPTAGTPLVSGLNHAAIITADLDRLSGFYVEVFGAERVEVPAPPGTRAAVVQLSAACGLALMEAPENLYAAGSVEMSTRGHLDHIALDAPTAASLEELRRRLVERGASDGQVSDYGAMLSVHFVDPDGMGCEVCWMRHPALEELLPPRPFTGSLVGLDASDRDDDEA
jgi:catechol 2,3-dioxygenase-like lactoylglutathione lyase family enzyme